MLKDIKGNINHSKTLQNHAVIIVIGLYLEALPIVQLMSQDCKRRILMLAFYVQMNGMPVKHLNPGDNLQVACDLPLCPQHLWMVQLGKYKKFKLQCYMSKLCLDPPWWLSGWGVAPLSPRTWPLFWWRQKVKMPTCSRFDPHVVKINPELSAMTRLITWVASAR